MSVIAVTASRTSPGATSLATGLALALSSEYERSLLIEADAAGGVLALRFDLEVTPSLTTFGSDIRNGYTHERVWRNTQDLRGARCMPAPVDPRLARSWVERVTPQLVEHLPTIGAPVIVDLGWVSETSPSLELAKSADVTLVVTRPEIAEVQALLFQVRQLQAAGATVGLVTVGTTPNDPQEVAAVAGVPLVAVLPDDAKVAAALRGAKFAPNKFRRSLLWRTIGGIASTLVDSGTIYARSADVEGAEIDLLSPQSVAAAATPSAYAELTPEALATDPFAEAEPALATAPAPSPGPAPVYDPTRVAAPVAAAPAPIAVPAPAPAPAPALAAEAPDRENHVDDDLDRTIDPDLFDDTKRLLEIPDAELVLSTGERCALDPDGSTIIGRNSECQIVIRDSQVSRRHGRLTRTITGWHYADLGSRNGSILNGRPCTDAFLSPGDELYIGNDRLTFQTVPTAAGLIRETESA